MKNCGENMQKIDEKTFVSMLQSYKEISTLPSSLYEIEHKWKGGVSCQIIWNRKLNFLILKIGLDFSKKFELRKELKEK